MRPVRRSLIEQWDVAAISVPSCKGMSENDSGPTLQGHPGAPSLSLRQKSTFAQAINYSGRRACIPEECKIIQSSQITHEQVPLQPGAHRRWPLRTHQFCPNTV
jgi:hypothetical protein